MNRKQLAIFIAISVVLLGATGAAAYYLFREKPPEQHFVQAEARHINETVRTNGSVEAAQDVDLSFERTGRVAKATLKVGDHVKAGDVLVELENAAEGALVQQARALLQQKQAGATASEIAFYQAAADAASADVDKTKSDTAAAIATAQAAVDTAENNLKLANGGDESLVVGQAYDAAIATYQASLPKLDDALAQADMILGVDNSAANAAWKGQLSVTNSGKLIIADNLYQEAKVANASAHVSTDLLIAGADHAQVDASGSSVQSALGKMSQLLQAVSDVLNATVSGGALSAADLSAKTATIQSERGAISAQNSSVVTSIQAVSNAKNSLTSYTITYNKAVQDLKTAQNSAASLVKLKQSAYDQALANLQSRTQPVREVDLAPLRASLNAAAVAYGKTRLVSPIDGVVSRQDAKVGALVSPNLPVVSVINEGAYQLEAQVSETDIAKLAIGNKAGVTLDAYGSAASFPATIIKIDPAASIVNGTSGYKTTLQFDNSDDRIKPGLTGNATISTEQRDAAVAVPQRSVIQQGNSYSVLVQGADGRIVSKTVDVGLRGDDGWVEITSGLNPGDQIVDFGS